MIPNEDNPSPLTTPGAPDAILAERWDVKREINRSANYDIDTLVQMAHESSERIRQRWQRETKETE